MKYQRSYIISFVERKISIIVLSLILIGSLFAFLLLSNFPLASSNFYPPCPWYYFTGTYCPGCGTVRGIDETLRGNLFGLYKFNKLALLFLPYLFYNFISLVIKSATGISIPFIQLSKNETLLILFLIIIYWILRNQIQFLMPI